MREILEHAAAVYKQFTLIKLKTEANWYNMKVGISRLLSLL